MEKAFIAWCESTERDIALAANPNLDYEGRATAGWPLTRLQDALMLCGVYACIVLVGLFRYLTQKPSAAPAKAADEGKISLAESFRREPIKYVQTVYNSVQVILCTWMVLAAVFEARNRNYSLVCNAFDSHEPAMARIEWVFYLSKALDFVDTMFIVARSKWDQFSFLHIYHHFSIFMTYWVVSVAAFDGDVYYTIIANSLVHAVMYFYYLLTCFGIRPSWGKYLTQMQMIQFITMNAQAIYIIAMDCPYPKPLTIFYLCYIISLFTLFFRFYIARWSKGSGKKGSKHAKSL